MDSLRDRPHTHRLARAAAPRQEVVPVMLFEDGDGRLVVRDARWPPGTTPEAEPLLRIGRTSLPLHHLAPAVVARLDAHGCVTVEGPDALNVLLALAEGVGLAGRQD